MVEINRNDKARKTHIVRIFGTNKDGDRLEDVWADVERIEEFETATQTTMPHNQFNNQSQRTNYRIKWNKDERDNENELSEDSQDMSASAMVVEEIVKIFDAKNETNFNDPEVWIPIRSRRRTKLNAAGQQVSGRIVKSFFGIAAGAQERRVKKRRFVHYDTTMDEHVRSIVADDPSIRKMLLDVNEYDFQEDTRDETQYVEVEVVERVTRAQGPSWTDQNRGDQKAFWNFKNDYLIAMSDEAKLEETGDNGAYPPFRLDAFQNIINVNFELRVYVLIFTSASCNVIVDEDKATLLDNRINQLGATVTGWLIECSANAGDNFATLFNTFVGPGPSDSPGNLLTWHVVPKDDDIKDDWFDKYVPYGGPGGVPEPQYRTGGLDHASDGPVNVPENPFYWSTGGSGDETILQNVSGQTIKFSIVHEDHIDSDVPKNKIPQMYINSGVTWKGNYRIALYRTDREGTGTIYQPPASWFAVEDGIAVGQKPPKVASDEPLDN